MNALALVSLLSLTAPAHAPDSPPVAHERERDYDRDRDHDRDRDRHERDWCPAEVARSFDALDDAVRQLDHHVDDLKGKPHERDRVRDDLRDLVKQLQASRAAACRAARREDKVVVVQPPPPPPPPPKVIPVLDGKQAGALSAAMNKEAFDDGKLSTLTFGLRNVCVTADQTRGFVKQLNFGSKKLDALKALAPRIVDVNNELKIIDAFDFESEKTDARAVLTSAATVPECRP